MTAALVIVLVVALIVGATTLHVPRPPTFPVPRPWSRSELDRMTHERWQDAEDAGL